MTFNSTNPSIVNLMKFLQPNLNLPQRQLEIADTCYDLANEMVITIDDSPELAAGLRKLLEAKDCFVRASLDLDPVDYRDR
jgi:hypothetical protein